MLKILFRVPRVAKVTLQDTLKPARICVPEVKTRMRQETLAAIGATSATIEAIAKLKDQWSAIVNVEKP